MKLYKCPYCGEPIGEFVTQPTKEDYKWFEFSQYRSFCPHCEAEIALDDEFQRWALLALPAIVLFVWDVAQAEQGGVDRFLLYGALILAVFGIVMLFVKRKLVVVNPPANTRLGGDEITPRDMAKGWGNSD